MERDERLPPACLDFETVQGDVVKSGAELTAYRKGKIEAARQEAAICAKESDLSSVERLNRALQGGIADLSDAIQNGPIFADIMDAKGLNDATKALQALKNMRDDMLDRCADDENAGKGKRGMKISVEFGNQGVQVNVGK